MCIRDRSRSSGREAPKNKSMFLTSYYEEKARRQTEVDRLLNRRMHLDKSNTDRMATEPTERTQQIAKVFRAVKNPFDRREVRQKLVALGDVGSRVEFVDYIIKKRSQAKSIKLFQMMPVIQNLSSKLVKKSQIISGENTPSSASKTSNRLLAFLASDNSPRNRRSKSNFVFNGFKKFSFFEQKERRIIRGLSQPFDKDLLKEQENSPDLSSKPIYKRNLLRISHIMEKRREEDDSSPDPSKLETMMNNLTTVSYTHLRAHETPEHLVCRLLLEKKKQRRP
eukprot:TRINITY_DN2156_c0_g1_i2.p1 TRINITY_DN2156_c0_g1~~TRINITY_DN2156_c0_g1_i2.p1  ORF type:complete len:281 (-),score=52.76 TRINITY_DN2156_c0_g1_i2:34-876(-)